MLFNKKDLIQSILKKYNKKEFTCVKKVNKETRGVMTSGKNQINFDLINGELFIETTITKDNIHLYYELMSDENLIAHSSIILNSVFHERFFFISKALAIGDYYLRDVTKVIKTKYYKTNGTSRPDIFNDGSCIDYGATHGTIGVSYFGVKDTLKPIKEYIAEIKESEAYKQTERI